MCTSLIVSLILSVLASPAPRESVLLYPDSLRDNQGFRLALEDLRAAYAREGRWLDAVAESEFDLSEVPASAIVVSRNSTLIRRWIAEGRLPRAPKKLESHWVRSLPTTGGRVVCVYGHDRRGDLYGLFHLARLLESNFEEAFHVSDLREPEFRWRVTSGETPENAIRLGYNAIVLNRPGDVSEATLLEIVRKRSVKTKIRKAAQQIRDAYHRAKSLGLRVIATCSEIESWGEVSPESFSTRSAKNLFRDRLMALSRETGPPSAMMIISSSDPLPSPFSRANVFTGSPSSDLDTLSFVNEAAHYAGISQTFLKVDSPELQALLKHHEDLEELDGFGVAGPFLGADLYEFTLEPSRFGLGTTPEFRGKLARRQYREALAHGAVGVWNHHHVPSPHRDRSLELWTEANAYVGSSLLWDLEQDPHEVLEQFCQRVAPELSSDLADLLRRTEEISEALEHPFKLSFVDGRAPDSVALNQLSREVGNKLSRFESTRDRTLDRVSDLLDHGQRFRTRLKARGYEESELHRLLRPQWWTYDLDQPFSWGHLWAPKPIHEPLMNQGATSIRSEEVPLRLIADIPAHEVGEWIISLSHRRPRGYDMTTIYHEEASLNVRVVESTPPAPMIQSYHEWLREDGSLRTILSTPEVAPLLSRTPILVDVIDLEGPAIDLVLCATHRETQEKIHLPLRRAGRVEETAADVLSTSLHHLQEGVEIAVAQEKMFLYNLHFETWGDPLFSEKSTLASSRATEWMAQHLDESPSRPGAPLRLRLDALERVAKRRPTPPAQTMTPLETGLVERTIAVWPRELSKTIQDLTQTNEARRASRSQPSDMAINTDRLRDELLHFYGYWPERQPLNLREMNPLHTSRGTIRRIAIESIASADIPVHLYEPKTDGRAPGVLLCASPRMDGKSDRVLQSFAFDLVSRGFCVLTFDAPNQGERRVDSLVNRPLEGWERQTRRLELLGLRLDALMAWEITRCLDLLSSHPSIEKGQLGVVAFDESGSLAIDSCLLDDRVSSIVTWGLPDAAVERARRYYPEPSVVGRDEMLIKDSTLADRIHALAPRFQTHISQSSRPEMAMTGKLYEALGQAERFTVHEVPLMKDHHEETRAFVLDQLTVSLKPEPVTDEDDPEPWVPLAVPSSLSQVVEGDPGHWHAFEKATLQARRDKRPTEKADIVKGVKRCLRYQAPRLPSTPDEGPPLLRDDVTRVSVKLEIQEGLEIHGDLAYSSGLDGRLPGLLMIGDSGRDELSVPSGTADRMAREGYLVLTLDPKGIGNTFDRPREGFGEGVTALSSLARRSLAIGRTLAGEQVSDLVTAMDYLRRHPRCRPDEINVWAQGSLTVIALFTALIDGQLTSLTLEGGPASLAQIFDSPFVDIPANLAIPHVLEVTDVPDLVHALAPMPIRLRQPLDAQGKPLNQAALEALYKTAKGAYRDMDRERSLRASTSR